MADDRADPGRPGGPDADDDLASLVEELSTTLESLQRTVGHDSRGPVGQRGPTPPTPRELLRFTEQYTIPTLIALLESGVRSLELLRATLRLLDGRGIEGASPATHERVQAVGRTTLDRVDAALSDLQSAVEGGEPSDPDARDLLADARALREEIDRRLDETTEDDERDWDGATRRTSGRAPPEGRNIPVHSAEDLEPTQSDGRAGRDEDDGVAVDVDAELESIRRDVRGERDAEPSDADEPGDPSTTGSGKDGETGADDETSARGSDDPSSGR